MGAVGSGLLCRVGEPFHLRAQAELPAAPDPPRAGPTSKGLLTGGRACAGPASAHEVSSQREGGAGPRLGEKAAPARVHTDDLGSGGTVSGILNC